MKKLRRLAVLLPILAGAGWGLVGMFVRILDRAGLDNTTIVFSRSVFCTIIMFIFLVITDPKKFRLAPRDFISVIGLTLAGNIFLMLTYNYAVMTVSLSLAAVLLCLAPIFVLIISAALFGEKITKKKVICAIVAFIGCSMLSGLFDSGSIGWNFTGILSGLASALFNGIFIILSKVLADKGYSSLTITFYSGLIASICLIPFSDLEAFGGFMAADPLSATGFMLMQAVVSSLLPTVAYMLSMHYVEAGRVAILESGAEPAAALVAGLILYREVPTAIGAIGMAVTVAALMVLAGDKE